MHSSYCTICIIFRMIALKGISILVLAVFLISARCQEPPAHSENATATPHAVPTEHVEPIKTEQHPAPATEAKVNPGPHSLTNSTDSLATPPPVQHIQPQVQPTHEGSIDYKQKVEELRQEVAKGVEIDHEDLKNKIQQVVGSMTPEQRDAFEQKLSSEARAAYEKYTKIREEQSAKERQEIERLKAQELKVSEDIQKLTDELSEYHNIELKLSGNNRTYTDFHFELPTQTAQDFRFAIPIDQQVSLKAHIYVNNDGIYSPVKDTEDEPVWIYIYENHDKLIAQDSFYSTKAMMFQGKANTTYQFRCVNHGKSKLIALFLSNLLLDNHIQDKLVVEDVADHLNRIHRVKVDLLMKMDQSRDEWMMKEMNQKRLMQGLEHYYFYNIAEIIVLGVVCVIQVESVRKLLMSSSVI